MTLLRMVEKKLQHMHREQQKKLQCIAITVLHNVYHTLRSHIAIAMKFQQIYLSVPIFTIQ